MMNKIILVLFLAAISFMGCKKNEEPVSKDEVKYFVKFDNTALADIKVPHGGTVVKPQTPIKEGATFVGWYKDANFSTLFDFSKPIENHTTLYGKWLITKVFYTVSFDTDYGDEIFPLLAESGKKILVKTPNKEGCTFEGWYSDIEMKNPFSTENELITADRTLYAKWTSIIPFTETQTTTGVIITNFNQLNFTNVIVPTTLNRKKVVGIQGVYPQNANDFMKSVTLPEGLLSIGEFAFSNCTGITNVNVPASVTSVGEESFSRNGNLTEVRFNSEIPPALLSNNAFMISPMQSTEVKILVPVGFLEDYKKAKNWDFYAAKNLSN
ncbi:MAG: InlB B-repeat-containing protein [Sphingobacteriaceae bacterium]|nr:InlB B-repeat-containing protein [Sphingobacteriaceae bacterium]